MYGIDLEVQEKNWNGEGLPSVGQMVSHFCSNVEVVAGNPDKNGYVIILRGGEYCYVRLALLKPIPNPKETAKKKAIDENQRLREQLDAWAEKYADLKIKSDANQWAHDNMQDQLASANSKLKSSNWYLTHLLEQDCISDCSLVREVETLLCKQLEVKG